MFQAKLKKVDFFKWKHWKTWEGLGARLLEAVCNIKKLGESLETVLQNSILLESKHNNWVSRYLIDLFVLCAHPKIIGYVTADQPPDPDGTIQHSQYVPEPENVPPMHTGVHGEYSSAAPLHTAGPGTGGQEEPFSPPELIPIAGSEHLNPTATLSHDRQVSIDSCSNLVIDEQGSTNTTTSTGVGGGFPHATSTSPSTGYTALNIDQQQPHVGYGGSSSSHNHPSDQQGFTPFVLASEVMESGPPSSQRQSNGGLRQQTSSHSQQHDQQLVQEHTELLPQGGHHDDIDNSAVSANKEKEQGQDSNTNKGDPPKQKRRHYNAYSSDDDDDVFLPNPPPKTQADRCTIAMETDEEKSTVVKEMEQPTKDDSPIGADDSLINDTSALSDGEMLGAVATETEGGATATEEELDVINDSQMEGEEPVVPLSSAAIKTGNQLYVATCVYMYVCVE